MKRQFIIILFTLLYLMLPDSTVFGYGQLDKTYGNIQRKVDNSGAFPTKKEYVYVFPGVSGPDEVSPAPEESPTPWSKYSKGTTSRLAILLTDPNSAWLGLAHGLKTIGIPFVITTDYKKALEHRVVIAYPTISGKTLSPDALWALAKVPQQGGTLIGVNIQGGGLNRIFGFKQAVETKNNYSMNFLPANSDLLASFQDERELSISLGDKRSGETPLGTTEYVFSQYSPLATFGNNATALTQKPYGRGGAFAWGLDIGFLMLKGYSDRAEEASRSYVNDFEPAIDSILRLLKEMYLKGEPTGVTLGTVPFNKELSVMITHDVDADISFANSLTYAAYEKSQGVKATYFIQTKYIHDWNDNVFFDSAHVPHVKQLSTLGMEIGSHSVSHSYAFSVFPLGTGTEKYPTYTPFVSERYTANNGSILGELRVSKFLLEKLCGNSKVISFRSGHLENPLSLPQALEGTGYMYSSVTTANNALTHLPFQLNHQRGFTSETNIFEFPITVEDEIPPLMGDRLPQALALARKIGKYGGVFNILIHPNITDHKLKFEQGFIEAVKDRAWFSSLGDFGHWWSARNKVEVDVYDENKMHVVAVEAPLPIEGLTLNIPKRWKLQGTSSSSTKLQQVENNVVIQRAEGSLKLIFADS